MHKVSLAVIGTGTVGGNLIGQLAGAGDRLRSSGVDLRTVCVADVDAVLIDPVGISEPVLANIASGKMKVSAISGAAGHIGLLDITARLKPLFGSDLIVADATATSALEAHLAWLAAGWRVATANKKPVTGSSDDYDRLMAARGPGGLPRYRHETACGAGLPVIGAIQDMLMSGDRILEVRAAVSGTLGFIFSACGEGREFARAVAEAKAQGFTEPDPRDDLSGLDVARKALILGRLAGRRLELADINVESLVPVNLKDCPVEDFLARLPFESGGIDSRMKDARSRGLSLRYLLTVSQSGVRVGIEGGGQGDPFASLRGPENLFVIRTSRYDQTPLMIRGPGAGGAVTAAGLFADIMRLFVC